MFCFVKICFEKRGTNMNGSSLVLSGIQHTVLLLVVRTAFAKNRFGRKTGFKNITNTHENSFVPP